MSNSNLYGYIDRRVPVPAKTITVGMMIGHGYSADEIEQKKVLNEACAEAYLKLDEADRNMIDSIINVFDSQCHSKNKFGRNLKNFGKTSAIELLAKLGIWLNAIEE